MTKVQTALIEALQGYGDPDATAEVVARASALPHDDAFVPAVAAIAREVWQRKLAVATARAKKANQWADALAAMNTLPVSDTVH
jgi:hypothetical protein